MSDDRERKGISLRKKKPDKRAKSSKNAPQISAPLQISGPRPQGLGAATLSSSGRPSQDSSRSGPRSDAPPRERPSRNNTTAELVKRRYSAKITQLPADFPGNGAPMPEMPKLPMQYMQQQPPPSRDGRPPGSSDGRRVKPDMRMLQDPNLRPDQFVSKVVADMSEGDIRQYQEDLRKHKNRTSMELQHNVYQNRTQFIKISKEAEKLKGEMRTLKQLMSELTATLGQTTSSANQNGDTITARKAANRSSVANLEALWNTQLHQLWKRIEGSQKYLPAIPGRHVVWESRKWVELNAATWKARRRVHLILLNDHLLVATEKKSRNEAAQSSQDKRSASEWRASRCWPLQDVQVADLSPKTKPGGQEGKGNTTNAINIRVGSESFTYAVYPGEEQNKIQLLATYRKAVEDLRKSQEVELEERGRAQDSYNYFATRDPNILKKTELMESLSDNVANNRASMFVDIEGKQQSIRSVESQLDELDIDIALQRFEDAVKKVEKLKALAKSIRGNAMAQGIVTFKVNERATKLANVLSKQLVSQNNWISSVKQHVTWIMRLGFEDRAREAYLEARGNLIKTRSRQCIFEGNLADYIFQISFIYFTIIKNTVDIYQKCFSQTLMSACVKWAKEHVDAFNVLLKRQLSSVDESSPVWKECMDQAREHAAMLREVGLDFSELVGKGFSEEEQRPVGLGVST
ncbi:putative exocyst complex component Exo84 [Byssothecium circinans]|uniref:Exocyst complex component EXO84 n=1 Tax=Byssothecium circinans TaxID=147558 RepID=A0A6A5TTU4_9PLEO|nr:putative exocyst complex component Exo84 [Byssothecium circinans]